MSVKIEIPEKAAYILRKLNENGYEAYVVGGCVRDAILGRKAMDWDITTSAKPEQVKKIFRRTIDTGIEHGTVTVMIEKEGFEVTTYRLDGEYEDSRHPKEVTFTGNLTDDLARRDFTINAMAYNPKDGLVDAFSGMKDLQEKCIRCVGSPTERFTEDALRMLRAVRFAAQLDFSIDDATKDAISRLAGNLKKISAERIHTELNKLLLSNHPERIMTAYETGITNVVLPEFDEMIKTEQNHPHHAYSVGEHCIRSLCAIREDEEFATLEERWKSALCWTMLLHDSGKTVCKTTDEKGIDHFYGHGLKSKEIVRNITKRLKFDNFRRDAMLKLTEYHDYHPQETYASVRKAIHTIGEEYMQGYFMVQKADILAQSEYKREEKLEKLTHTRQLYEKITEEQQCVSIKDLALSGSDLIEAGVPKGPQIGKALSYLLEQVLEDETKNEREQLLGLLKKFMHES